MLRLFLALLLLHQALASCSIGQETDPRGKAKSSDGYNDNVQCTQAIRNHVKMEFQASLQYMLMAVHFAQDTVSLEGFAKFFFASADEERQHGIKFLEYLKMRGDEQVDIGIDSLRPILDKDTWTDGDEALRDALDMEKAVSRAVRELIVKCEPVGDYYSADYLTGTWLEEQLAGQRDLAGKINTLSNFRKTNAHLADWMFSNALMNKA